MEIFKELRSFEEWKIFSENTTEVFSIAAREDLLKQLSINGLVEPHTLTRYSPDEVKINGFNYRETIRAGRLISRHRALLKVCEHIKLQDGSELLDRKTRIYAPEALTDFALFLRSSYPYFIGSEYAESKDEISNIFPICHQDLLNLTFPPDVFNVIFSNDVFEHLPDIDKALSEIYRVLSKNNGILISTFPFLYGKKSGIVKARIVDQKLELLSEPEYHGNPMRPQEGSLVFELPAWDIVERAKKIGFSDSYMIFISSSKNGILGAGVNGVFVFVALKGN